MKEVVIIGAGLGGLMTGNLLAKKGHKVKIFEAHSMPGGYTAGFHRKGFYFESGTLSFESSASVLKAMEDINLSEKVEFVKQKTRWISGKIDGTPQSFDDFKKMVYSGHPSEKEALDRYFSEVENIMNALDTSDKPMPYLYNGLQFLLAILSYIPNGRKMMKVTKQYQDMTVSEFIEKFFSKGSELYGFFQSFGYPDMSANFIGGAFLSILNDYWTVKKGMQFWADILAGNFKSLGGDLKLNSYVNRIITSKGDAVGVSCNNVDYKADYVISACDYKKTLLKLLDDKSLVPEKTQERVRKASVSEGIFTVYLGLNMPNEELEKHMVVPHVFYYDEKPGLDIYNSSDEKFFDKTSISIYSPSMVNFEHAPAGKSSLMLQTTVPYRWMDNWGNGDKERYKQLKYSAMEEMILKASQVFPGLKDSIEYKDAATPLTYERFTHNTDGATSAWSWNPKKRFYDNSISVNVETPVKNLYIGSCWAMEIGGIPGALAAAYQCAKKVK